MPKPKKQIWQAFEAPAGLARSAADWQRSLGQNFEALRIFLKATKGLASVVPCAARPRCHCDHEVVEHGRDDIVAVCRCSPKRCPTVPINRMNAVIYELDRAALGALIAKTIGARPEKKAADTHHTTWQIGTYEPKIGSSIPLILTIQTDESDFDRVVAALAAEAQQAFVLLTPTDAYWKPAHTTTLLRRRGTLVSLSKIVSLNGGLSAGQPLKTVLAGFLEEVLPAEEELYIFKRNGATWTVAFRGNPKSIRHSKGMDDIATLLLNPNQEMHCTQVRGNSWTSASSHIDPDSLVSDRDEPEASTSKRTKGQTVLVDAVGDEESKTNYRRRLDKLKEKIETAEELGDSDTVAKLKQEQFVLTREFGRLVGYGGSLRRQGVGKQAQQAVSIAIIRALRAIKPEHPELWKHLDTSIRREQYFEYRAPKDIRWSVSH